MGAESERFGLPVCHWKVGMRVGGVIECHTAMSCLCRKCGEEVIVRQFERDWV